VPSHVPRVEVCLWKEGDAVCRRAVHPLPGQLPPQQPLFPERVLKNTGLLLLLESIRDGCKTSSRSTAQLPDKFL